MEEARENQNRETALEASLDQESIDRGFSANQIEGLL
jgi:hypothetical protein